MGSRSAQRLSLVLVIHPAVCCSNDLIEKFVEIPFPFPERATPDFEMVAEWDLDQLKGYLWSWSSTQRFVAATNRNPIDRIADVPPAVWKSPPQKHRIIWPLILR